MAQAGEFLLCKHETLSSNTSPTKNKTKQKVIRMVQFMLY
jgi:hypothetical protein